MKISGFFCFNFLNTYLKKQQNKHFTLKFILYLPRNLFTKIASS